MMKNIVSGIILLLLVSTSIYGQSTETLEPKAPPILVTRAEEDYSSLKDNDSIDFFLRDLKYISLNQHSRSYLTLGGEYRARLDHTRNGGFGTENSTSYLQRLNFHAALNINTRLKLFTEFYHGLSSAGEVAVQSDNIDLHQVFMDWKIADQEDKMIKLRLGRQEIGYGSSRLVGIRNGPNLRRSFDMAQLRMKFHETKM
ncbi:MAG: alginate export family protein, partial [Bacteroidota bacterium]